MEWCEGSTASLGWGELESGPAAFPDDHLTVADGASATGLRITMEPLAVPWVGVQPENVTGIYALLDGRDGWGTSAGVFLRFDGPVSGLEVARGTSQDQSRIHFIALSAGGAEVVPFESWTLDEDSTLMLRPLRPLEPETRHAVVVTTEVEGQDGRCVAPSDGLARVLRGEGSVAGEAALVPRWREALAALKLRADTVSAGTVFTTGSHYGVSTV
ncbi:MAG: hypothetical protein VX938_03690, partial [Myxococcota bacterium]|nr:hypothetical protein [Myxococcota bacterium]